MAHKILSDNNNKAVVCISEEGSFSGLVREVRLQRTTERGKDKGCDGAYPVQEEKQRWEEVDQKERSEGTGLYAVQESSAYGNLGVGTGSENDV